MTDKEIINKGRKIELDLDDGSGSATVLKPPKTDTGASWQNVIAGVLQKAPPELIRLGIRVLSLGGVDGLSSQTFIFTCDPWIHV